MSYLASLRKTLAAALVMACVLAWAPVPALGSDEPGITVEHMADASTAVLETVPADTGAANADNGIELLDDPQDLVVEDDGGEGVGAPDATSEAVITAQGDAASKAPVLRGHAYVHGTGWQEGRKKGDGIVLGNTKDGLQLEALKLETSKGTVLYKANVQDVGWMGWERNGAQAGYAGADKRIEAVRLRLSASMSARWSLQYRARVWSRGWMGWASDGAPVGTSGFGKKICALQVRVVPVGTALPASDEDAYVDAGLTASAYAQKTGWSRAKKGYDVTIGNAAKSRRLEAMAIDKPGLDVSGGVVYRVHMQRVGWQEPVKNGAVAGLPGQGLRMEAITIKLAGQLAASYDVWYRMHVQGLGWLAWATNGQKAGTEGLSLRVEAVQIALAPKGQRAPSADGQNVNVPFVKRFKASYRVMAGGGWGEWKASGSAGKGSGPAVNALGVMLPAGVPARVQCSAHLSGVGWTDYRDGENGVGSAQSTVEGVRMRLVGAASNVASVWYRVYVRGVGWTRWAHDGGAAGSVGKSLPIHAMQVRVVPHGEDGPSNESAALAYECVDANSPQLRKDANHMQKRLLSAVGSTPWPGKSLCAGWVGNVYANAGFGMMYGNANDLYAWYCGSANPRQLKVGMIVAVSTHTRSIPGQRWGHVGIYVGDGWVVHSIDAGVKKMRLSDWVERYGTTVPPKWGWYGNIVLA